MGERCTSIERENDENDCPCTKNNKVITSFIFKLENMNPCGEEILERGMG